MRYWRDGLHVLTEMVVRIKRRNPTFFATKRRGESWSFWSTLIATRIQFSVSFLCVVSITAVVSTTAEVPIRLSIVGRRRLQEIRMSVRRAFSDLDPAN